MRLFAAIALAPEVIRALEQLTRSLRSPDDGLRWTSSETWHITLQFLGETSSETCECVVRRLRDIKAPQVPIWFQGTGVFDRAGVFWTGVAVSPELRMLEKAVAAATSGCGFTSESRSYHPHVTLARSKGDDRGRALRKLQDREQTSLELPRFTASEFLLLESFLGSGGAKHEIRERFPLITAG
ncbi:MAG: RNA 2',3'-cyclic phosphodiesterase [Acidobacteria bacterium]|nr:RNA 2',3'-cyclic phosphodiesterase [Acidobacteriota bacterium]